MNNLDKQYIALLQDILDNGVKKDDRTGTGTLSVFGRHIRHKMSDGFPLLTTKKVHFKSVVTELLWFLRGNTNIKYLVDNDCHIWDGDAYKNYLRKVIRDKDIVRYLKSYSIDTKGVPTIEFYSKDEYIERIKNDDTFAQKWGELGPVYGAQWRDWNGKTEVTYPGVRDENGHLKPFHIKTYGIDQIANSINLLKTDPDSRRNRVNAWNVGELDSMVLPPCHTDFQFYTRELSLEEKIKYAPVKSMLHPDGTGLLFYDYDWDKAPTRAISLMWNQRSVDTFLGLPFNIASYGLLLEIIAKEVNMVPDELIGNLGDVHLYSNHIEQAKEQMTREPYPLPKLGKIPNHWVFQDNWESFNPSDFTLENYQSHPTIKAPLSN
jgi:thymidylate synthase